MSTGGVAIAYSAPSSRATGFVVTAGVWNQDVVDNIIAIGAHAHTGADGDGASTLTAGNGTNSAPTYSFSSDSNTGVYRAAADQLGLSMGGTAVILTSSMVSSNLLNNAAMIDRTRYLPMHLIGYDVTLGTSRYWTFANAATTSIIFGAKLPSDYVSGSVKINFLYGSTVTSNNLRIAVDVYQDRDGQAEANLDTNTSTQAVSGSASVMTLYTDAVTTNPNTAASNYIKVMIKRIGADAADTNTGTMNITTPWLEYTADM